MFNCFLALKFLFEILSNFKLAFIGRQLELVGFIRAVRLFMMWGSVFAACGSWFAVRGLHILR